MIKIKNEAWSAEADAKMILDYMDAEDAVKLVVKMKEELLKSFTKASLMTDKFKVNNVFKNAYRELSDMIDYAIEEHRDATSMKADTDGNEIKYNKYFATFVDVLETIIPPALYEFQEFDKYGNLSKFVVQFGFYKTDSILFTVDMKSFNCEVKYNLRDPELTYESNEELLHMIDDRANTTYKGNKDL